MDDDVWGWELIVNLGSCEIERITSEQNIRDFVKELVDKIDMKAYGDPLIAHFATHDPRKGGFSLCQMIETSAITAHFVDINGNVFLNVFSCKEFNIATVVDTARKYFQPKALDTRLVTRKPPESFNL